MHRRPDNVPMSRCHGELDDFTKPGDRRLSETIGA
jgi:hypothetical protein